MRLASLQHLSLQIPFKTAFKHASAERSATQTLIVKAVSGEGIVGHGEGCPREYVTGETMDSAHAFVAAHRQALLEQVRDLASLAAWAERHREVIDANPSAWTAIELAVLDLIGKTGGQPIEALLGLGRLAGRFGYSAVLGDAAPAQFEAQLAHYLKAGFSDFKIKLSGDLERDLLKVQALARANISAANVRADANNLWENAASAIDHLGALAYPFSALEEPLRPGDWQGMLDVAASTGASIILDESLLRGEQLEQLRPTAGRWIVNLRVSKMGGLLRSLEMVRKARALGIRINVGAHVGETSILTRAALVVAHGARDILVAQEGAFGTHLLAHDVTDAPIMFGAGGILTADDAIADAGGLGIEMSEAVLKASVTVPQTR